MIEIGRKCRRVHHPARQPDGLDNDLPVKLVIQVIGVYLGFVERIIAFQPHPAPRFRALLPGGDGKARFLVKL